MRLCVLQITQSFSQHMKKVATGAIIGLMHSQLGVAVSTLIVLSFKERLKSRLDFGRWLIHGYFAA